jgi:hypothetical protein
VRCCIKETRPILFANRFIIIFHAKIAMLLFLIWNF